MGFKNFDKKSMNKFFAKLSWILLEQKCLYYTLTHSKYDKLRISDHQYDTVEHAYVKTGIFLRKSTHIHEMVGFNKNLSPATESVYYKIKERKSAIPVGNKLLKFIKEEILVK